MGHDGQLLGRSRRLLLGRRIVVRAIKGRHIVDRRIGIVRNVARNMRFDVDGTALARSRLADGRRLGGDHGGRRIKVELAIDDRIFAGLFLVDLGGGG